MQELIKLELKKEIYNRGGYMLFLDSVGGEVINLEFKAVDLNYKERFFNSKTEDKLLNELYSNGKITLRGFWNEQEKKFRIRK